MGEIANLMLPRSKCAESLLRLLKGCQFRHLWTLHTELQRKWLYKEITAREVLSGFNGTPVNFGTSTFPLHFADLLVVVEV